MKKYFVLALVVLMILSIAACTAPAAPDPEPPTDPEVTPPVETLRIAIVTSPSGVDDGSFNQDNYNGILAFIADNPHATVTPIQELDFANAVNAVADIVADYDVIVTPGFQFGPIAKIARENPEKKFILIDSFPVDEYGDTVELDNVFAMMFAEQESGFFAGVAAAMETQTGRVAVVNGIAFPSNVNYQFGFMAGVAYANAHLGTNAEWIEIAAYAGTDVTGANVGGNYIGDFADPATGRIVGDALIALGVDILFVAAGDSGNGVFTSAMEATGVMVIGCDVDQFDDGVIGDRNIVLTSAVKVMGLNVQRQLQAIVDGTFRGGNHVLTAATDGTGFISREGRHQLSDATLAALEEVFELVKNGIIVPPHNFSNFTVENFPGLA